MPRVKKEAEKETKTAKKTTKADAKKEAKKVAKPVSAKKVEKTEKVEKKAPAKTETPKPAKKAVKSKASANEDTGSVDFQIDNFSLKIKSLAKHLKNHIHDFDSRRGLLIMVGKRRRLLNYLKKNDPEKYEVAVKSLKLKA